MLRQLLPLGFLACAACAEPTPPTSITTATILPEPALQVSHTVASGEARYSIVRGECRIRWEIRTVEPAVILHRSDCALPLAEQLPLIEVLWKSVPSAAEPSRQLFWGRLCPDQACGERQLSQRLALAAYRSSGWDSRHGRPYAGHENEFVRGLANQAPIYAELSALFARHAVMLDLTGVEKVLIARASELPYYSELQAEGVPGEAKLPFDALVWFRLKPLP